MSARPKFAERFNTIEMFRYCEQCGRCSSACPITGVNEFNIRRLVRHVELDLIDDIASSPMPWFCAVCGRCEDACPNGIKILDITRTLRAIGPGDRFPQTPPCVQACPAGIDVPGYLRFIARGENDKAYQLIMERAPLPGVLGRVCTHPCETACKRGEVNTPIAICAAKRYAADRAGDLSAWISETAPDTGRKVAVIGAGPAGLTAGFYLRKKGHRVTVFEARPKPGGMLRYGIPRYRLPDNVLDKEINQLLSAGIQLKTRHKLGVDFKIEQLREDGFEAVFVGIGAQLSRRIEIDGSDLHPVHWGVEFLTQVAEGRSIPMGEKVVVIGGGNVAVDVALTALRLGARQASLACLETRAEMPANPWEIEQARQEGVELLYSWGPGRIIGSDGKVRGLELVRCAFVFDAQGNFCPYFDDTKMTIAADQVILAIGQASETAFCQDFCFLDEQKELPVQGGLIAIDAATQQTEARGVFAGGDAANGSATVIQAIAAGRRAAASIDRYLGGDGVVEVGSWKLEVGRGEMEGGSWKGEGGNGQPYDGSRERGFAELERVAIPSLPVSARHAGFAEVELGCDPEQVTAEARRCLQCDLEICLAQEKRAVEEGG